MPCKSLKVSAINIIECSVTDKTCSDMNSVQGSERKLRVDKRIASVIKNVEFCIWEINNNQTLK